MTFQTASKNVLNLSRIVAAGFLVVVLANWSTCSAQVADATAQQEKTDDVLMRKEWVKMSPTGSRVKFQVPVKPRYVERTFTPVKGAPPIKVRLHTSTASEGLASFVVSYHDMHERPKGKYGVKNSLEGAIRGSLANVSGRLLSETNEIKLKNVPGRQFVYEFQYKQGERTFLVISRVFLKGRRMYQLSAVMDAKIFQEAIAGRFLNSFEFARPKPDLPPVPKAPAPTPAVR